MVPITVSPTQAGGGLVAAGPAAPRARTAAGVAPATEAASVTLSPEAQALLGTPSQGTGPDGATAGTGTNLLDRLRGFAQGLDRLGHAGRSPAERVADIQDRLADLLQRMQRALLLGDTRTVAAIAKEAAGLAKDLAGAVKDAARLARDAGASAGTAAEAPAGAEAAASAAGAAQDADAAVAAPHSAQDAAATGTAAIRAAALASQAGTVDPGLQQQVARALVTLRALIGAAKAAVMRRDARGRAAAPSDEAYRKTVREAEKALQEAEADIQASLGPAAPAGADGSAG